MPISWIALFAGIILFFGGGIAFLRYYGNILMVDKRCERNSLIVVGIGIVVGLAGFTGIVLSIN